MKGITCTCLAPSGGLKQYTEDWKELPSINQNLWSTRCLSKLRLQFKVWSRLKCAYSGVEISIKNWGVGRVLHHGSDIIWADPSFRGHREGSKGNTWEGPKKVGHSKAIRRDNLLVRQSPTSGGRIVVRSPDSGFQVSTN